MKIKLDENLAAHGKAILEAAGHDVMTVNEQKLSGATDNRIYEVCRDEGRVLVTLDHDFGHTLRYPPEGTAGIVVLECRGRQSLGALAGRVAQLILVLREYPIDGKLIIIEPGRVRIHQPRE